MIDIEYIRSFFPPTIARESRFDRYMLKEYLQLLILDYLATTPNINKVAFIGGTNLRLIQGIDGIRLFQNLRQIDLHFAAKRIALCGKT